MRAASIQISIVENDKKKAISRVKTKVRQCADADLILLPEIWNLGFMSFDRYISEAEEKNGPTLEAMQSLAVETGSYLHSGSFVEKDRGRYFNSSFLISPTGELLAHYRKIHLFGYDSREKEILTPGNRVEVVKTPLGTMGMATCYDLRFPELFRHMVDKGAEVFLICSAWPYPRLEPWLLFNRVRAMENQCFLLSANCTGKNRDSRFAGHSMMVDPKGDVLASAGDDEAIVVADIDTARVGRARQDFPALVDRVDWLNRQTGPGQPVKSRGCP